MSLKNTRNKEFIKKKVKLGFRGYPVATMACYGIDSQSASKLVIGIIEKDGDEPLLRKWFADSGDIRNCPEIIDEISDFLRENSVKSVISAGRVIGCPHEEGVDYPLGESCPSCPFWRNKDRWSGNTIQ